MMAIRTDSLSEEQMSLIKELRYKSKTLFEFSSSVVKRFFVGETILKTLSSKTNGVGGQFIKNVGSVRNYALLSAIQNETESMNLLYRSDGRLNKAMAVFSKKTVFCARMAVAEAIEALFPKTANIYWKISQQCTEVYVELQNLVCGEFYKGYLFRISDTGFCADTLFTTLRKYDCQPSDYYTLGEISLASDTYDKNGKLTYSGMMFMHSLSNTDESKAKYDLKNISIAGLTMDVDFFIIGEIKGEEARYLLNAAYTGQLCAATIHAPSAPKAIDKRYYARELANALREFAEKPQNIDNFESYLKYCFIDWKEKFANTPEKMIEDMEHFAEMEV